MIKEVNKAVEVLRKGGIILYPTDTVWGLGCDATNPEAVERIYRLKKSENKHSMLVLIYPIELVSTCIREVPELAWELFELTESPLTLILPNAMGVAENLLPEERTLGIRVPHHKFCEDMLFRLRKPVVSTSANISGEPAPTHLGEISQEIIDGVDFVVDPTFEGSPTGQPSSIMSLGVGGEIKIIRE